MKPRHCANADCTEIFKPDSVDDIYCHRCKVASEAEEIFLTNREATKRLHTIKQRHRKLNSQDIYPIHERTRERPYDGSPDARDRKISPTHRKVVFSSVKGGGVLDEVRQVIDKDYRRKRQHQKRQAEEKRAQEIEEAIHQAAARGDKRALDFLAKRSEEKRKKRQEKINSKQKKAKERMERKAERGNRMAQALREAGFGDSE